MAKLTIAQKTKLREILSKIDGTRATMPRHQIPGALNAADKAGDELASFLVSEG